MSEFRSLVINSLIRKGCFAAPKDEYLDGFKLKRERVTERLLEMLRDEIAGESVGVSALSIAPYTIVTCRIATGRSSFS
jgi:hypothetical protein